MKYLLAVLLSLSLVTPAAAQVSVGVGISLPSVSIGINLPFPRLVVIPGYPVYYAPQADANLFFYDGFYWVFRNDIWYTSAWYNGPWAIVDPFYVPVFILRVPVSFYRYPPPYFVGWQRDAPPRWGNHWGRDWESRRGGWDNWNRHSVPTRAPIPSYQRQYSGDRYPARVEQQAVINRDQYKYQPNEPVVRQHYQAVQQQAPAVQVPQKRQEQVRPARVERAPAQREQQVAPRAPQQEQRAPQAPTPQVAPRAPQQGQRAPQAPTPQVAPRSQQGPPSAREQVTPRQQDPQEQHGKPEQGQQERGQSGEKGQGKGNR